jgi:hypothetical protein
MSHLTEISADFDSVGVIFHLIQPTIHPIPHDCRARIARLKASDKEKSRVLRTDTARTKQLRGDLAMKGESRRRCTMFPRAEAVVSRRMFREIVIPVAGLWALRVWVWRVKSNGT